MQLITLHLNLILTFWLFYVYLFLQKKYSTHTLTQMVCPPWERPESPEEIHTSLYTNSWTWLRDRKRERDTERTEDSHERPPSTIVSHFNLAYTPLPQGVVIIILEVNVTKIKGITFLPISIFILLNMRGPLPDCAKAFYLIVDSKIHWQSKESKHKQRRSYTWHINVVMQDGVLLYWEVLSYDKKSFWYF